MTPAVSDPLIFTAILLQPLHTATVLHTPVNAPFIRMVCMYIRMFIDTVEAHATATNM